MATVSRRVNNTDGGKDDPFLKTLVAVVALGTLSGGSDAAVYDEETLAAFKDCMVGLVGSLEAIDSEFPEFRAGEVGLALRKKRSLLRNLPEETAALVMLDRLNGLDGGYENYVREACTAADDVADVLGELRDGSPDAARGMWLRLP